MKASYSVKVTGTPKCLAVFLLGCAASWMSGCGQPSGGSAPAASAAAEVHEFTVEGMTCEGCVGTVTSAINEVPGVESVQVSLEGKKAVVSADFAKVSDSAIEAAVREAGYEARPAATQEKP